MDSFQQLLSRLLFVFLVSSPQTFRASPRKQVVFHHLGPKPERHNSSTALFLIELSDGVEFHDSVLFVVEEQRPDFPLKANVFSFVKQLLGIDAVNQPARGIHFSNLEELFALFELWYFLRWMSGQIYTFRTYLYGEALVLLLYNTAKAFNHLFHLLVLFAIGQNED